MPSDSIVGFLQQVRSQQLLFPEQIEKLVQEPDWPQEGLERLCQYLLERGILTRYQAEALLQGRGQELNLGGYPVLEAIGPCPGGTVYKVLHPTLRLPLLLRRLRADEASLGEPVEAFFERVRQWGMWQHPHVVAALDVGRTDDDIYIVLDPLGDHADVETLTVELGGPMPGPVFQEMARALASVLRSLHEQGGTHGRICPAHLVLGPLREKVRPDGSRSRRPASDATIKLTELGLLPRLPPVRQQPPPRQYLAYLPPEFFDDPTPTPAADVYALGATLYFLLTARPPFKGDDPATLMEAIAQAPLKPLARLRPDIPGEISALVERMLAREPGQRPTAAEVEQSLTSQTSFPSRSGSLPLAEDLPESAPPAESVSSRHLPVAVPVQSSSVGPEPAADWSEAWSSHMAATAATEPPQRRARPITDAERARSRRMLLLGGLLHLTAVTLLLLWIFGAFTSSPEPEPTPPQKKENKIPPKTRPRNPQVG